MGFGGSVKEMRSTKIRMMDTRRSHTSFSGAHKGHVITMAAKL